MGSRQWGGEGEEGEGSLTQRAQRSRRGAEKRGKRERGEEEDPLRLTLFGTSPGSPRIMHESYDSSRSLRR